MHLVRRGEAVDAEAADGEPVAEKRTGAVVGGREELGPVATSKSQVTI